MTPFFLSEIRGDKACLSDEEARHCIRVMRFKAGDKLIGVDGEGKMYVSLIESLEKKRVKLKITEIHPEWGEKPQKITLAVSPLHKPDRFEWLVEKSVELGATHIIPYISIRTVKPAIRLERLNRIMIAALKQCMRSRLPILEAPVRYDEMLESVEGDQKLIGTSTATKHIQELGSEIGRASSVVVLIGPEGDFSEEELESARNSGFTEVNLGTNRLRTETASVLILSSLKVFMGY